MPISTPNSPKHDALSAFEARQLVSRDPTLVLETRGSFGERLADRVAAFGGSWRFILIFLSVLLIWTVLNGTVLGKNAFDPYPFIFLNLILSMLAAIQAPVIMMSQKRQSDKDRQMAAFDFQVNLKAEMEIMALHEKLDSLRNEQMLKILTGQQEQIDLLTQLLKSKGT